MGLKMSLFERLSQVARAEANYVKSQSITPEEEMERAISQIRSAIIATQIAIGRSPESQAKFLKRRLALLESQLSKAEAKRDELLRRMSKAKKQLQNKVNPSKSPFERMEEKVLEVEACAEAAGELEEFSCVYIGSVASSCTPEENQLSRKVDDELEALRKQIDNL
jgi:hypothetical protein